MHLDLSDTQLPDDELAEFMQRCEREKKKELDELRAIRVKQYSYRCVAGM